MTSSNLGPPSSPIKIGVVTSLSGPYADFGPGIFDGVQLAAYQVNKSGGIDGHPIQLIEEDDAGSTTQVVQVYQQLVEVDGVQVIIGPTTSGLLEAVANYVVQRHVVDIGVSTTSGALDNLTGAGTYIFRTAASDQLQTLAQTAIINSKGYDRVAILVADESSQTTALGDLEAELGSKIVYTTTLDPTATSYTTQLAAAKATNPDVIVYWNSGPPMGVVLFQEAEQLGLGNVPVIIGAGPDPSYVSNAASASYLLSTGAIGTEASSPDPAAYNLFNSSFTQLFGKAPTEFSDTAYDAGNIAIQAIALAGYNGTAIGEAIPTVASHYYGADGWRILSSAGAPIAQAYALWSVSNSTGVPTTVSVGSWSETSGLELSP